MDLPADPGSESQFFRNRLKTASSPYLLQHQDQPVAWQEWNRETLEYARRSQRLILVSIGYATCHWCHVMGNGAFSDPQTAEYLNRYFVSIKVDREQRPDLDEYFMDFVTRTTGRGGWPLNVILSPEGYPFFGATYFPATGERGMPAFIQVLERVREWYAQNGAKVKEFAMVASPPATTRIDRDALALKILGAFDDEWGGFGKSMKFPPYNTLLLLIHFHAYTRSDAAREMLIRTLDSMALGGLHDHLQGGFYRYAVDREWRIPHFEKMLYDQAMHLWVFGLAAAHFKRAEDRGVTEKLVRALEESFSDGDGLFFSAHDADTDHVEGATYLWRLEELRRILNAEEYRCFVRAYRVSAEGNFEGRNHLVRKPGSIGDSRLSEVEEKLLAERRRRVQPFTDRKVVTSWNALTGVALAVAGRRLGKPEWMAKAAGVYDALRRRHLRAGVLAHSSLDGSLQPGEFLEDHAALLLLATVLYEDNARAAAGEKYLDGVRQGLGDLERFHKEDNQWFANLDTDDFRRIPARPLDQPIPSARSMAEMARLRARIILGLEVTDPGFYSLLESDFLNLTAFFASGALHVVHSSESIPWRALPVNAMQLPGDGYQVCVDFACRDFPNRESLINTLTEDKK